MRWPWRKTPSPMASRMWWNAHASSNYTFNFAKVREARDALSEKLAGRITLATGCDFHLNPENLTAIRADAAPFCINQKDYLLVEFNEFSIPPSMDQRLHELQLAGLRPVITHPERTVFCGATGTIVALGQLGLLRANHGGIADRRIWPGRAGRCRGRGLGEDWCTSLPAMRTIRRGAR